MRLIALFPVAFVLVGCSVLQDATLPQASYADPGYTPDLNPEIKESVPVREYKNGFIDDFEKGVSNWSLTHAHKMNLFGKDGAKNLATDLQVPFLGEIPLVQSIREAGDVGRPAALQTATPTELAFEELTKNVVQELVQRNKDLPPTEAIKITTMAGCSAVKKK